MAARIIKALALITILTMPGWAWAQTPVTVDQKDYQVATKRLRIGTDTARYFTSILQTISAAATHRHSPTGKAVYDYVQSLLPTITAGAGISVTGTTPNFTITNTGDTNASDDLTTSSTAGGDLSGPFSNLQIVANAVGAAEIAADAVGSSEIATDAVGSAEIATGAVTTSEILNSTILGADLASMGATTGQVLTWGGSTWAPADPTGGGGGSGHTIRDDGTDMTPRAALNFTSTAQILIDAIDDSGLNETAIELYLNADAVSYTRYLTTAWSLMIWQ